MPRLSFLPLLLLSFWAAAGNAADPAYECRFSDAPLTIDGKADEEAWKNAETIDKFTLPWLKANSRPAKTATKAKLLWDRENLYFFAEMEDADLYADIDEADGMTWENDVFELFFKPAESKPGYYELQVSAAGTTMDMFLPRRNAGGYRRFIKDGAFHLETKVVRRGTLNKWQDKDEGWSVEGKMPWTDFHRTGGRPAIDEEWRFALCRYDYSVAFEGPELSTSAPLGTLDRPDFHRFEDYAPIRFVAAKEKSAGVKPHGIEKYTPVTTSRVVGSPEPPPPYRVERTLPEWKSNFPIEIAAEPGSTRFLFIDQKWSYGPARVARTSDDPAKGESETLFEVDGVAYTLGFHPKFAENGYFYVGLNGPQGGKKKCRILRYTIDRSPPYKFLRDSEKVILEWESDGHNGAAMTFGHDGMMYVTTGDGTSDSDTNVVGQGLEHLLAKVLRIDVDKPDADRAYSVPKDNPFVEREGARPETWAYGFRNPWRITTDAKTGAIWVGNNGQDLWEQIFRVDRGANYGWSVFEGSHLFYPARKLGPTPHVPPTLEHPHSEARSLTGGVVYYGKDLPELVGAYIYGDYSTGKIWAAKHDGSRVTWHKEIADTTLAISAIAVDHAGELLIADHRGEGKGGFHRLVPNGDKPPYDPAAFPKKLSESGLFTDVKAHRMQPGLIPYSVNAPLWSDGTHKVRFLALAGEKPTIGMRATGGWDLPDGTVLVKSFALDATENDPATRRWIETRFMTKQDGEWVGYSYAWNDEQTDATLVAAEGLNRDFAIRTPTGERTQNWRYPSRTECMVCHSRAANYMLGPSTVQMNRDHDYGGVVDNQLRTLEHLGLLSVDTAGESAELLKTQLEKDGLKKSDVDEQVGWFRNPKDQRSPAKSSSLLTKSPDKYPRLVDPYAKREDLTKRARSYLHANCSHCHVEAGGGNAQFDVAFQTSEDKTKLVDVKPVHDGFGLTDPRLVAAGHPERSVLLHRVVTRERGRMPQLATSVPDQGAVELLRDWIASLKSEPETKSSEQP